MKKDDNKKRWKKSQKIELAFRERSKYTPAFLEEIKSYFTSLIRMLPTEISLNHMSILDVGSAGTSIFIILSEGINTKYAIDPLYEQIFNLNPFMKSIEEYQDVNFISKPIEDVALNQKFDIIFALNVLDHMNNLEVIIDKISQLLSPNGYIIITVDCYSSTLIKNIQSFFDLDLGHPHHFDEHDIMQLFSQYRLIKSDDKYTMSQASKYPVSQEHPQEHPKIYQPLKLFRTAMQQIDTFGEKNVFYITKYLCCQAICLSIACLSRTQESVLPLKKRRIFVFTR